MRQLTPLTSLESLKKSAKRWLRAIKLNDPDALVRLHNAHPQAPDSPCLRDIQHAVALEYGAESWQALQNRLLTIKHSQGPSAPTNNGGLDSAPPAPYFIDRRDRSITALHQVDPDNWERILSEVKSQRIPTIYAAGKMTDAVLEQISHLDHVTDLHLDGSRQLTDEGLQHLTNMPQLQVLELGGDITDRGLEPLRHLTQLRKFQMCWQTRVSDAGIANLSCCNEIESVNLMGSNTGDGAILALDGNSRLRQLTTGREVTDAGLLHLHQIPGLKNWAGGRARNSLMTASAEPNQLVIDGPFTDAGVSTLVGLDGLYALSFFWHCPAITPKCIVPLAQLPRLGFLGCDGKFCDDEAMGYIARLPRLRKLMAQGTVATNAGFSELSRSRTLEYIWGRECPNLTGEGFVALSGIRTLRGLAVSCKGVDDTALSALPEFPSLKEFMPMDVPDEGFRHIGACKKLESLWCMYCRNTTDAATEHIAGLSGLKSYYAGATQITDRSLEILSRMSSLESLSFWKCEGITDDGLRHIATLPRLKKVSLDGLTQITEAAPSLFPAGVHVKFAG